MTKSIIVDRNSDLTNVSVIIRGEGQTLIGIPRDMPAKKVEVLKSYEQNRD
jgi:hypothetical protein